MEHNIQKCVCKTCCDKRLTASPRQLRQLRREQYPKQDLAKTFTSLGLSLMVCGFILVFFMLLIGLIVG